MRRLNKYLMGYTEDMKVDLVGNVHLVAGTAAAIPQILSLLKEKGVVIDGNPDMYVRVYRAFGIDDAIELRDRSNKRPIAGLQRFFIVATPGMTSEAQNALLKTLEEPPADAAFFFIIPAPEMLLSTLRSRAQILIPDQTSKREEVVDARAFLASDSQRRLDMLKPLLEKDEGDKRDIGNIIGFLSSLERLLHKKPDGLQAIYRARKYVGDKGALVKPLLEQIALLTPKVG